MTPQQKNEIDKNARAFIDQIISINKKYDLGTEVPADVYESAVNENVRMVTAIASRKR